MRRTGQVPGSTRGGQPGREPLQVARDDIDLEVHLAPARSVPSVVTSSVCGTRLTPKRAPADVVDREADAVDADRTLARDVAREARRHARNSMRTERASSCRATRRDAVDVAGHVVPAERLAGAQRLFEIHACPARQLPSVVTSSVSRDTSARNASSVESRHRQTARRSPRCCRRCAALEPNGLDHEPPSPPARG